MSIEKIQTKTLDDIPSKFPLIQGKEMGKVCLIKTPHLSGLTRKRVGRSTESRRQTKNTCIFLS